MSEKDFKDGQQPIDPAGTPIENLPRRKRRKLVMKIIAGVVTAVILLVLAAPTLLSTRPVVSIILGQVNDKLNGHIEISSLSLGWFSGIKVEGVRVFDNAKTQIAEVDRLVIPLPLWKAVAGKLALGDVVCDGLSLDARYDSEHRLNFAQLLKQNPAPPAGPAVPTAPPATGNVPITAEASKPSKLPEISGSIKLTNCRATVSQPGKPTVFITSVNGQIGIPNINDPITDALDLKLRTGDGPEGMLNITGMAAAIKQNQVALESAEIHQKIEVTDLDLQASRPFIADSAGVDTLQGVIGVHVAVDVTGGKDAVIDATVNGRKKISIGGKVLKGDLFSTDKFTAAIPKLTAVFPDGLEKWQSGRIKVGTDAGTSPILFQVDQGQVTMLVDAVPQAILNIIDRNSPGFDGSVVFNSDFDLSKIIPQLRNRIGLPEGLQISSGGLTQKITLSMTPARADLSSDTNITQLVGTETGENHTTKALSIDPIHESLSASYHGGSDVRQLDLKISSKSINGEFTGATLANLQGNLNANLSSLSAEMEQFLAGKLNLGGVVMLNIASVGPVGNSRLAVSITGQNLQYASSTGSPIMEPNLQLNLGANLVGDADHPVQAVKGLAVTLKTGDPNAPTIDLLAEAEQIQPGDNLSDFRLTHLVADLAKLQKQFAPVGAKEQGTIVNQGVLIVTAQGEMKGSDISLDALKITADHLLFAHQTADGTQSTAVDAGSLHVDGSAARTAAHSNMVTLRGDLGEICHVLGAYKGAAYPYQGTYALNEDFATTDGKTTVQGSLQVSKFQTLRGSAVTFSDDMLAIANNVTIDRSGGQGGDGGDESINIASLTAEAQSTHAFKLALANGSIEHVPTRRDMNLKPTLDYDLAKIWPIAQPIMGDKYKTLKITGQFSKQFNITGSYPAGEPSTQAIKTLHADGDLSIATFDYDGLNLQNFIVPFTLDNGKVVTVYANKPAGQNTAAPAIANGGTADFGNVTVDLTQDPPRLSMPANKLLISKLTINPLFSNSFLAKYLNNPVFTGNNNATGLLDLTMVDCDALPMGALVEQAIPTNTGKADIKFSLTDLHIGLAGISGLAAAIKQDSIAANVNDGTVSVAKGLSTEHISFVSGSYSLNFDGTVRLADDAMVPLNLSVGPLTAIAKNAFGTHDQNVLKYLPDRANVQVEGTVDHAHVRLDKVIGKLLADASAKAIEGGLLGGDKNNGGNPLGGLLRGFGKKKN